MSKKTQKVLDKAIDLLDKKGWCQNQFAKDKKGCSVAIGSKEAASFCVQGALLKAGVNNLKFDTSLKVYNVLNQLVPEGYIEWNDEKGRTKEEVIDLLIGARSML